MAGRINQSDKIRCSFCNKTQDQVHKLIAGPAGIFICDECIETCNDILEEEMQDYEDNDSMDINLLTPEEIKGFDRLDYRFSPEMSSEDTYIFLKAEK